MIVNHKVETKTGIIYQPKAKTHKVFEEDQTTTKPTESQFKAKKFRPRPGQLFPIPKIKKSKQPGATPKLIQISVEYQYNTINKMHHKTD